MKKVHMVCRNSDDEYTLELPDAKHADMVDYINYTLRDGYFMKSAHARVFDSPGAMQRLVRWITLRAAPADGSEPATEPQLRYLRILKVNIEPGLSKAAASRLIDAAKSGNLGSNYGFYTDGSN